MNTSPNYPLAYAIESKGSFVTICRALRVAVRYLSPAEIAAFSLQVESGEAMKRIPISQDPCLYEACCRMSEAQAWIRDTDRKQLAELVRIAGYQDCRRRFHRDWRNSERPFISFAEFCERNFEPLRKQVDAPEPEHGGDDGR